MLPPRGLPKTGIDKEKKDVQEEDEEDKEEDEDTRPLGSDERKRPGQARACRLRRDGDFGRESVIGRTRSSGRRRTTGVCLTNYSWGFFIVGYPP